MLRELVGKIGRLTLPRSDSVINLERKFAVGAGLAVHQAIWALCALELGRGGVRDTQKPRALQVGVDELRVRQIGATHIGCDNRGA